MSDARPVFRADCPCGVTLTITLDAPVEGYRFVGACPECKRTVDARRVLTLTCDEAQSEA